ncbi:acetyl-CoA acetyltransferase [Lacimicrobium alkaliphilum]|uniref:Acetyl-CoA acetyltransferase n=1 Tax=Lacimicrobium alkaliphilum TaxID=1526571 RepID=A0A0U3BAD9_9ALTE|nr:acetyl-CoA acetyltransferase [Lacimicrobium alkaliphilum]ALT00538.1 acetyl-CoA acetyltransferase [Lacimicrobium alkaliphilum]
MTKVYVLGGAQTDFAVNWARQQKDIYDLFEQSLNQALCASAIDASDIDVAHVGNFISSLFTGQAHLGGFFGHANKALEHVPSSRHEAACASGSMALLAAMRDIESGHYQLACVMGIELMRNVDGATGAAHLGAAAWRGKETLGCNYPWPRMFADLFEEYQQRYNTDIGYLRRIAEINFANARQNPNAQTRNWRFGPDSFSADEQANPVVEAPLRKQDCGQITDGAAVLFLASEAYAARYAKQRGIALQSLPHIKGWGHRCAPMLLKHKLMQSREAELIFPYVRGTFTDALSRAGLADINSLDGMEVHDCFSMTEYMLIDHLGLTAPGQSWQAIEEGTIERQGSFPVNPSGGLIGLGHPVGATGVRMMLDAYKQVRSEAGAYQVEGAKNFGTFNLGGSATTCASFILGV